MESFEPGSFEWLLHYNGLSKRNGLDLSVKDGEAEVLVRPLFPETFPDAGLPHDFPEKMRLEEKTGWEDRNTDIKKPYWSISHFQNTDRTKFVTAIILKNDQNKDKLPKVGRFEGKDFLGVRITQNDWTTEIYLNLTADGRIMHRNSLNVMNGWYTDSYLTALTFPEGADTSNPMNLKRIFMASGSFLRNGDKTLIHSLSKFFVTVDMEGNDRTIQFQGQPNARLLLDADKKPSSVTLNGIRQTIDYNQKTKRIELKINNSK